MKKPKTHIVVKVRHSWTNETQKIHKLHYVEKFDEVYSLAFEQHWMNNNLEQQLRRACKKKKNKTLHLLTYSDYPKKASMEERIFVVSILAVRTIDRTVYIHFEIAKDQTNEN